MITNAMTVDVEDYFQVSAFEGAVSRSQWNSIITRVEANTLRILDLFDANGVKATFFVLGWVAERHSSLVAEIVARGHELASHGYDHRRVHTLSREEFQDDVLRARALLEDAGDTAVIGYRAPSYSIDARNLWAHDVLAETGHLYSSSVYPVKHDLYGMPDAPRFHFAAGGEVNILEIPVTTVRLGQKNLPCGGGGFFRLLPYVLYRKGLQAVNNTDREAAIFYFHPWEIDPDQPVQEGLSLKSRFRHYVNLSRMEGKLSRLLQDFQWGRVDEIFPVHRPAQSASSQTAAYRAQA